MGREAIIGCYYQLGEPLRLLPEASEPHAWELSQDQSEGRPCNMLERLGET